MANSEKLFISHIDYCAVKDLVTKDVLLHRKVDKGLYKLNFNSFLCTHNTNDNNGDDCALFQQDKQAFYTITTYLIDHIMCTGVNVYHNDISSNSSTINVSSNSSTVMWH